MHVRIVFQMFAHGIVCYVLTLGLKVVGIPDSVFVVPAVPDFSGALIAESEGVTAFDQL